MNAHYKQNGLQMHTGYGLSHRNNHFPLYMSSCLSCLLFGWVEVFRSGLKKYSDFLTLGDVDWQLDQSLQKGKLERHETYSFTLCG